MTALLPRALLISSLRFYAAHPWQAVLALCSVALGAAVVVAVGLANNSALGSFDQAISEISPRASHRLVSRRGAIENAVLARLEREWQITQAWPELSLPGSVMQNAEAIGDLTLHAAMPLREALPGVGGQRQLLNTEVLADWLSGEPVVALSRTLMSEGAVGLGDTISVAIGDSIHALRVVAEFDAVGLVRAAVADVSLLQRLASTPGSFDSVALSSGSRDNRVSWSWIPS